MHRFTLPHPRKCNPVTGEWFAKLVLALLCIRSAAVSGLRHLGIWLFLAALAACPLFAAADAQAQTAVPLVSNVLPAHTELDVDSHAAQQFTTGAHSAGYVLTSVGLGLIGDMPTYTVSIHENNSATDIAPFRRVAARRRIATSMRRTGRTSAIRAPAAAAP